MCYETGYSYRITWTITPQQSPMRALVTPLFQVGIPMVWYLLLPNT
jgi:hypothetical protein